MTSMPDPHAERTRDLSLTQRIRLDLERRILSGALRPGERVPFEHELMAEYGCARMTVGKAMAQLVEAGLIERRRRAGSFVRKPAEQSAVLHIPDLKGEVLAHGKAYACEVLSRQARQASGDDQTRLQTHDVKQVLALICLHRADGEAYAYEDRLISLDAVPDARDMAFDNEPPGTWLLNHVPWQEAEHVISAASAEGRIATLLDIEPRAACLVVERRTWAGSNVLTAVRLWYPGARHRLYARFTPSGG